MHFSRIFIKYFQPKEFNEQCLIIRDTTPPFLPTPHPSSLYPTPSHPQILSAGTLSLLCCCRTKDGFPDKRKSTSVISPEVSNGSFVGLDDHELVVPQEGKTKTSLDRSLRDSPGKQKLGSPDIHRRASEPVVDVKNSSKKDDLGSVKRSRSVRVKKVDLPRIQAAVLSAI
jgi:hypothetical protein